MIPCCGSSFCDECKHNIHCSDFSFSRSICTFWINLLSKIFDLNSGVRTALLESEDNECPDCNEKGSSPGSLIPNRFLRNSVNSFKNETGYNKPRQTKSKSLWAADMFLSFIIGCFLICLCFISRTSSTSSG